MAKTFGVWGIDIGQCALKAIRLEMIDGQPTATAFDYIEHPKILSQPDADPDALTREALEKFLERNPLGKDQIAIGVPGQSGLVRFVKLPPVEEKKVPDIVKFEAKQQIPFPLEEVVWDFQKISGGEAVGGFAMETEIGLFAMKREIIARHLAHYQAVKAEVHVVQMAPLALANYATYEILKRGGPGGIEGDAPPPEVEDDVPRNKKRCAVVLDIGTDSSNLIITDGQKILWQRPVPLGGNNFTRALTKEMKLTFAKAEHLKRNASKSPDLVNILKALKPVLTDFVGEVQRSLGFFTNTHRDAHVSYMIGLGSAFKLPGLEKFLAAKLSLELRRPVTFERLSGDQVLSDPTFTENVLTFPVAYGLALQALGLGRIQTNLLPGEIRTDRLIRAKKPWAAMAAATVLLGTGVAAWGVGVEYKAAADTKVKSALSAADNQIALAKKQVADEAKKETEKAAALAEVKAIVSGSEERLNWPRVLEVINAALPKPPSALNANDGNLELPEQVPYWRDEKAQLALRKQRDRIARGISLEEIFDDDKLEDLPKVNIEAIDARYTDNLQGFLLNAQMFAQESSGLNIFADLPFPPDQRVKNEPLATPAAGGPGAAPPAVPGVPGAQGLPPTAKRPLETPKAPDGGGWILEIRGYTFHNDGTNFIRRTLVKNLQRFDKFAEKTDPSADPKDPKKNKVASLLGAEVVDPAKARVSHVFLAVSKENDFKPRATAPGGITQPQVGTGGFLYVHQSQLNSLIVPKSVDPNAAASGSAAPAGTPPAAAPGTPGASVSPTAGTPWQGLITPANPNPAGILGLETPPAAATGAGPAPVPAPSTGPGTTPAPPQKAKKLTEFIVYLIWREPVGLEMNGLPPAGTPATPGAVAAPVATPQTR
jgi:type IV pilus assembly protein PilM